VSSEFISVRGASRLYGMDNDDLEGSNDRSSKQDGQLDEDRRLDEGRLLNERRSKDGHDGRDGLLHEQCNNFSYDGRPQWPRKIQVMDDGRGGRQGRDD
jgi:hypothetical protein